MDLKIIAKKRNEVMGRNEVTAEMQEKTISSKKVIRDKLAALLNTSESNIAIVKIASNFGSPHAKIIARVYDTPEALKKIEVKYIRERNFGKEKKAEVATGPEAPPANFKK